MPTLTQQSFPEDINAKIGFDLTRNGRIEKDFFLAEASGLGGHAGPEMVLSRLEADAWRKHMHQRPAGRAADAGSGNKFNQRSPTASTRKYPR